MTKRAKFGAALASLAVTISLAGCSDSSPSPSNDNSEGGEITVTIGSAPDSLDPGIANNLVSLGLIWNTHLGLLSYRHAPGAAGYEIIPALAKALPTVSADGTTYDFKLRAGLHYSDGTAVKASDFAHTVERSLKLNWGGASFLKPILGVSEFESGKAESISGITTNDGANTISIVLSHPYGPLSNVLALSGLGFVPGSAPLDADPGVPGVGPYALAPDFDPTRSFSLEKVDDFADMGIPDIPTGYLNKITFNVVSNNQSAAQSVLDGSADVFDAHDVIPPAMIAQVQSTAADRYKVHPTAEPFYFWMNVNTPPFDDIRVRQAVAMAIDRNALVKLSSGQLTNACYMLPENFPGHPDTPCPWTDAEGKPLLDEAKDLLADADVAGAKVTVWGQQRSPRKEWASYMADLLNKLGFDADLKLLDDSIYYQTVGSENTGAQIGTASFGAQFADPYSIYISLDPASVTPENSYNLARVEDPKLGDTMTKLAEQDITSPATQAKWQELDEYATGQAYHAVFGTGGYPQFYSDRLKFDDGAFHALYANDWSLLQLK